MSSLNVNVPETRLTNRKNVLISNLSRAWHIHILTYAGSRASVPNNFTVSRIVDYTQGKWHDDEYERVRRLSWHVREVVVSSRK